MSSLSAPRRQFQNIGRKLFVDGAISFGGVVTVDPEKKKTGVKRANTPTDYERVTSVLEHIFPLLVLLKASPLIADVKVTSADVDGKETVVPLESTNKRAFAEALANVGTEEFNIRVTVDKNQKAAFREMMEEACNTVELAQRAINSLCAMEGMEPFISDDLKLEESLPSVAPVGRQPAALPPAPVDNGRLKAQPLKRAEAVEQTGGGKPAAAQARQKNKPRRSKRAVVRSGV